MIKRILSFVMSFIIAFSVSTLSSVHAVDRNTDIDISKCLSFDANSTNWTDIDRVGFVVTMVGWNWSVDGYCDESAPGIWSFDPAEFDVIFDGSKYSVQFYPNSLADKCTAPLWFDETCLGDTAYCTGKMYDAENNWDSVQLYAEVKWKNSAPAPVKYITCKGDVVGETLYSGTTPYKRLANFIQSNLWFAREQTGKGDQKILDDIAKALGLTEDDVEKAIQKAGTGKWYRYFSTITGADDYSDKDVILVDTTAVSDVIQSSDDLSFCLYNKNKNNLNYYEGYADLPVIKLDKNHWVFSFDPRAYGYNATNDLFLDSAEFTTLDFYGVLLSCPVHVDKSCLGDTLVFTGNSIRPINNPVRYIANWKNHPNNKYGTAMFFDSEYNLVGDVEPNFEEKLELLRNYVNNVLPRIRSTVIETDQELIDLAAEEIGMKKSDVACLFPNNGSDIWKERDSELPDGFSYDAGNLYLKATNEDVPLGYYKFTPDSSINYYLLKATTPDPIGNYSSSSSSSSQYVYKPDTKYEVVRYDDNNEFTCVSKTTLTAIKGYYFFFRPDNGYCFGYNTSSETKNNNSSSGSVTAGSSFPLAAPDVKSVTCTSDGLTIKWDAIEGAENYRVFVKGDTDWMIVGDTTDTSISYNNCLSGNGYTFSVRCISGDGQQYLSPMGYSGNSGHYLDAPTVISTQSLAEGNKITWNPVPGNAKYRVFVKSGKSWKAIGDTFNTYFIHSSQGEGTIIAQAGEEYTYTVACISINGYVITSGYNKTGWSQKYYGEEPIGPPKPYFLGDADGNGELESVDVTFIQRCIAQIPTPYTKAELMRGDVDGSGDLELTDVTAIQYYLCHLKTPYPIGETIA